MTVPRATAADGNPAVSAFMVVAPFAFAYFISYLFRSINAVIAPDLVRAFSLSASELGLVTSAYFLAFAAFQLPLGLLLDRFGPRRVDSGLLLVAASGAIVFGTASSPGFLLLGRALIGLGVCGCLMSSIKAVALWFPPHRLSAMNAWIFFTGGMGALARRRRWKPCCTSPTGAASSWDWPWPPWPRRRSSTSWHPNG
jgi:MFS family permease